MSAETVEDIKAGDTVDQPPYCCHQEMEEWDRPGGELWACWICDCEIYTTNDTVTHVLRCPEH
ncbi:hypothetical protein [Kitasatospora sp. GP82]|uniref:hypothetical protein n=1 Tax=Kitasatospora sp. GP82 TaxID=3035089 RepID=UPI002473BACB|nr:hypothetical protein [Kitasatospora sp. GP82]MDH6125944.1 putative component of type VI protein secretion system [Kitasatospora sp. GP82]